MRNIEWRKRSGMKEEDEGWRIRYVGQRKRSGMKRENKGSKNESWKWILTKTN